MNILFTLNPNHEVFKIIKNQSQEEEQKEK
jgi:hypothetical protein